MQKLTVLILIIGTLLFTFGSIFMVSGCSSRKAEGVAIYLTRDDVPPSQMKDLESTKIAQSPVLSMQDIITYNTQTHELTLTQAAFERLYRLEVPVRGKSFIMCVDRKPVYWGAFWTPISSQSFEGVTIWKPFSLKEPYVVTLELGYPAPSFYKGEDPRNNPDLIKSFQATNKLITGLDLSSIAQLPQSMKGYELYSWPKAGEWYFTLITGTNRNKTAEEIVSGEDFISQAGWVQVRVTGIESIKSLLAKLPAGEEIFWLSGARAAQELGENVSFSLPPDADIETLKEQAVQGSLKLTVFPDMR